MPSRKEPEAGPSQDSVKDLIAELLASINAAATTSHVTINIGRFNVTVSSGSDSLNMGLARKAASGIAGTSSRNPSATSKASAKPARSKPAWQRIPFPASSILLQSTPACASPYASSPATADTPTQAAAEPPASVHAAQATQASTQSSMVTAAAPDTAVLAASPAAAARTTASINASTHMGTAVLSECTKPSVASDGNEIPSPISTKITHSGMRRGDMPTSAAATSASAIMGSCSSSSSSRPAVSWNSLSGPGLSPAMQLPHASSSSAMHGVQGGCGIEGSTLLELCSRSCGQVQEDGSVDWDNQRFREILAAHLQELLGCTVEDCYPVLADTHQGQAQASSSSASSGEDGSRLVLAPLRGGRGAGAGAVVVSSHQASAAAPHDASAAKSLHATIATRAATSVRAAKWVRATCVRAATSTPSATPVCVGHLAAGAPHGGMAHRPRVSQAKAKGLQGKCVSWPLS